MAKLKESYDYLVIDFETVDPYVKDGMGAGWVYGIKVLGCAFQYPDGSADYILSKDAILKRIERTKTLIVFNANYDIGILKMWSIDINQFLIIDVLVMAKMYDTSKLSYSLNNLSKEYLDDNKSDEPMGQIAIDSELINTTDISKAIKFAKENMDKIQKINKQIVADYAIHDVVLTYQLYELFKQHDINYRHDFYSDLVKCLIHARARGVRIDLLKLLEVEAQLQLRIIECQRELNAFNGGEGVNCKSSKQLGQLLIKNGYNVEMTDKDNYKCDEAALKEMDNPIADCILKTRKLYTLKLNFIDKIIRYQEKTIRADKTKFGIDYFYGYVYPEIKILGATATGRCSSNSPNIQQIPSRDKEYAKLIRGIIVPDEGYQFICSADYSAQEPRLIVNDAALMKCTEADQIIKQFRADPNTDFHQIAADLMGVERVVAKTIGLGLLYGMGITKLAKSINTSIEQASFYRDLYFERLPFMKKLIENMSATLKERGYIKTLLGNQLKLDPVTYDDNGRERTFEYKAINKRTQGNAANQTNAALVCLYRAGIDFMFPVHDEVVASVNSIEEANKIKDIMENAIKLAIPVVVDVNLGTSWGECKK